MAAKLDTIQTLEIAEGAEIRLRIASPISRALACVMDSIVRIGVYIVVFIVLGIALGGTGEFGSGVTIIAVFLIEWFYFVPWEMSRRGATPGKMMLGLRVVATSGAQLNLTQALIRNLLRHFDNQPTLVLAVMLGTSDVPFTMIAFSLLFPPYGVAILLSMLTPRFQRFGDLVADTVVVYRDNDEDLYVFRKEDSSSQVAPLAPGIPLSREEQRAVVQFSDRASEWPMDRRQELAEHAEGLTKAKGTESIDKLLGYAKWIRSS